MFGTLFIIFSSIVWGHGVHSDEDQKNGRVIMETTREYVSTTSFFKHLVQKYTYDDFSLRATRRPNSKNFLSPHSLVTRSHFWIEDRKYIASHQRKIDVPNQRKSLCFQGQGMGFALASELRRNKNDRYDPMKPQLILINERTGKLSGFAWGSTWFPYSKPPIMRDKSGNTLVDQKEWFVHVAGVHLIDGGFQPCMRRESKIVGDFKLGIFCNTFGLWHNAFWTLHGMVDQNGRFAFMKARIPGELIWDDEGVLFDTNEKVCGDSPISRYEPWFVENDEYLVEWINLNYSEPAPHGVDPQ